MLTIFRIAFLFLVVQISLGNWIVQSQPSPQAPIKQESKDPIEGKSETNKPANSSAKASLDNTIGPPSNLEKQPSREAKGGPDEGTEFAVLFGVKFKITDGLLALFTLLLVIVTGALAAIAIWQGCQLKASVSLAREEFNATHRPRIVVRRISPIEEGRTITGIQYTVHNVGDTECTITAISDQIWMPGAARDLPAIPAYTPHREQLIHLECNGSMAIRHPDTESEFIDELNFLFGFAEESNPGHVVIPRLLFLGYVNYIDRAGTKRQTAFLRQFNFTTKRFSPIDHPEYEYQD